MGAEFVSILTYAGRAAPTLIGTATTTQAENARRAARGYGRHFASDVNFALVLRGGTGRYVTYQTADEIASSQYRRACYDRTGIADRLSYVSVVPERATSISVYRSRSHGCFSDREIDRAAMLMPILAASVELHDGTRAPATMRADSRVDVARAQLRARYPLMSARELEVASCAKAGMSARQIARELGIAETTVITHRKSAYARIGVANLRELLISC